MNKGKKPLFTYIPTYYKAFRAFNNYIVSFLLSIINIKSIKNVNFCKIHFCEYKRTLPNNVSNTTLPRCDLTNIISKR